MGKYAEFVCDLHGHTNRSDGSDTPLEYLQHATKRKMKIVAITDHDKIPPETVVTEDGKIQIMDYAKLLGLILLKGIEISCETDIEDVHLVCFGCDWKSEYFRELEAYTVRNKIKSYKELVNRLSRIGMKISWDELLQNHGSPIEETDIQKKLIFNLMAEKGYTRDWSEAKLFVKNTPELQVQREKPTAVSVIREVHRQGGIVILAHPYLISEYVRYNGMIIKRKELIDSLIDAGLDGIEGRYTYDKTSYAGTLTKEEIYQEISQRYRGRIPIISGGSDYHGDQKRGVLNPRDIGECGLTEQEFYQNELLVKLL